MDVRILMRPTIATLNLLYIATTYSITQQIPFSVI